MTGLNLILVAFNLLTFDNQPLINNMRDFEITAQGLTAVDYRDEVPPTDEFPVADPTLAAEIATVVEPPAKAKLTIADTEQGSNPLIIGSLALVPKPGIPKDPLLASSQALIPIKGEVIPEGDQGLLKIITADYAKANCILPFALNGGILEIASGNSLKQANVRAILETKGFKNIQFVHYQEQTVLREIEKRYNRISISSINVQEDRSLAQDIPQAWQISFSHSPEEDILSTDKQLERLRDWAIAESVRRRATDINIDLRRDPADFKRRYLRIRSTIDGDMVVLKEQELGEERYRQLTRLFKTQCHTVDSQREHSGQSGVSPAVVDYGGKRDFVELRMNFSPTGDEGESICLRIQRKTDWPFNLNTLGLLPEQQDTLQWLLELKQGLVTVVGMINCGKNITLTSIIQELAYRYPTKNIMTIEDPVEIRVDGAIQINIDKLFHRKKGSEIEKYTFADALRDVLRQNAKYIMVGETRDAETAQTVVKGSIIGHLFFTTMHAETSTAAIDRLRDFGISDNSIANTLKATMTQRLIKLSCLDCQREREDWNDYRKKIKQLDDYLALINWEREPLLLRSTGITADGEVCTACQGTGYQGRTGIFEILPIGQLLKVKTMITKGKPGWQIRQAVVNQSALKQIDPFITLWQAGLYKVLRGETTFNALFEVLERPLPDFEGLNAR
jgi:general secretion pathway protein E